MTLHATMPPPGTAGWWDWEIGRHLAQLMATLDGGRLDRRKPKLDPHPPWPPAQGRRQREQDLALMENWANDVQEALPEPRTGPFGTYHERRHNEAATEARTLAGMVGLGCGLARTDTARESEA